MTVSLDEGEFLFTSESVTEGHPDKIADQISDAVLDRALAADPYSRVACETVLTTGLVLAGSLAFLASAVVSDRRNSLFALGILVVSYPIFLLTPRRRPTPGGSPP